MHSAENYAFQTPQVCFIGHAKLAPGWVLIRVNFDPKEEIGPEVGDEHSFEGGCSFTRLQYTQLYVMLGLLGHTLVMLTRTTCMHYLYLQSVRTSHPCWDAGRCHQAWLCCSQGSCQVTRMYVVCAYMCH